MQQAENKKKFIPIITFKSDSNTLHIEVETERLSIRTYRDEDFEKCLKLYSDESLIKYFDNGKPKSCLELTTLTEDKGKRFSENGEPFGLFSIFQKIDNSFIGQIDILPFDKHGTVEIGCIFDKHFHNQGFPMEALRAFIFSFINEINTQCFKYHGSPINKVIATVHPSNKASKRIVQNLGMTFEKTEERFGNPRLWFSLILERANWTHTWEPDTYKQHSSVQRDAALELLKMIAWKGTEHVLDVGCGDGKITAVIADHVKAGNVIGIDSSQEMINFAKQSFLPSDVPNLEFLKLDAQYLDYKQKFDVIFSSFALQWVKNIRAFFRSAYSCLRPTGLLVTIIPLGISTALDEAINTIIAKKTWAHFFNSLSDMPTFYSESEYYELISEHPYKIDRFITIERNIIFPSRECFEKYVIQWFVYLNFVPNHLKISFFKEIIDRYLENEPLLKTGEVVFRFSTLEIIVSKIIH
jgi:trans-aconitate 2-methyltransferase